MADREQGQAVGQCIAEEIERVGAQRHRFGGDPGAGLEHEHAGVDADPDPRDRAVARRDTIELIVGLTGLALLLVVESTLVLGLRGKTPGQYFESRDPLAFGGYLESLARFGLMPWLLMLGIDRGGAPRAD